MNITIKTNLGLQARLWNFILVFGLMLWVGGCGGNSGSSTPDAKNNVSFPGLVGIIASTSGLTAQVSVNGGVPETFIPTVSGVGISLTIPNLPVGQDTLDVSFYLNSVIIANTTTSGTVFANSTTPMTLSSYSYPDSDGDGWTNLAELNIGTDPNNRLSHPLAETPSSSTNYVLVGNPIASPSVGKAASASYEEAVWSSQPGKMTSSNYTLNPGF